MKTKIKKIETFDYNGPVYNVEVEPSHLVKDDQFFLQSNTGVVVHNCHPRDNIALRYMASELDLGYDLFDAIMNAREIQAKNIADRLVFAAQQNPRMSDIVIHGKAYKPGVEYLDGSYSLLIGSYVEKLGYRPIYVDPLTGDDYRPYKPAIFLLAHSASTTYKYTGQSDVDTLYCNIPDGSVVIDPWRNYVNDKCEVIHYGNTRQQ